MAGSAGHFTGARPNGKGISAKIITEPAISVGHRTLPNTLNGCFKRKRSSPAADNAWRGGALGGCDGTVEKEIESAHWTEEDALGIYTRGTWVEDTVHGKIWAFQDSEGPLNLTGLRPPLFSSFLICLALLAADRKTAQIRFNAAKHSFLNMRLGPPPGRLGGIFPLFHLPPRSSKMCERCSPSVTSCFEREPGSFLGV